MTDPAQSAELSLTGQRVMLTMPMHRDMDGRVAIAIAATEQICLAHQLPLSINKTYGTPFVDVARNKLAALFLASDCTMMFCIDSDTLWQPPDFMRLVALCAAGLSVIGAAYVLRQDEVKFVLGGMEGEPAKTEYGCYTWPELVMGLGFVCIAREVLEALAERSPKLLLPNDADNNVVPRIFRNEERETKEARARGADIQLFGEDVNFFHDVQALGRDVWLDPSVQLGHIGTKIYTADVREHFARATP